MSLDIGSSVGTSLILQRRKIVSLLLLHVITTESIVGLTHRLGTFYPEEVHGWHVIGKMSNCTRAEPQATTNAKRLGVIILNAENPDGQQSEGNLGLYYAFMARNPKKVHIVHCIQFNGSSLKKSVKCGQIVWPR